jgi:hypothetical protein
MEGDREELMTPEEATEKYKPEYDRKIEQTELNYKDMCVAGIKEAIIIGKKQTVIDSPPIVSTIFNVAQDRVISQLLYKGYNVKSTSNYIIISWE